MADRLYLPSSSAAPGITPNADAAWNLTTGFDRVLAVRTPSNTSAASKTTAASSVVQNILAVRNPTPR
jgi:hypothetical protein